MQVLNSVRRPGDRRPSILWSLGLLGAFAVAFAICRPDAVRADDAPTTVEEEERLEAIDHHTARAWKAFRSGNHDEVLARTKRVERYDAGSALVPYLEGRVHARVGEYEKALEVVRPAVPTHPDHRGLEGLLYDLLLETGQTEELARSAAAAAGRDERNAAAWCALGLAREEQGDRKRALESYEKALAAYKRDTSKAEDLPWVARAAVRVTRVSPDPRDDLLPDAMKLLERYHDAHPDDQDVLRMVADLFQEDRGTKGQAKAAKYYRLVLNDNTEVAEARVGLARTFLVFWQQDRAMKELERALQTNPNLVPALNLLASIHVGNGDYDRAEELLERARKVNASSRETASVDAARLWITGQREDYARIEKEVLGSDPAYGRFYVVVSELVGERQRRYDVAAELAAKAIQADPNDALGHRVLGEALMNLGRTEEAREAFDTAVAKSKRYADVKRDNWLEVLDVLDDFKTVSSKNFVVRVHPSEVAVMEKYLPDLLEASYDALTKKYGFVPSSEVRVDAFHRADDFSVRSIGVPGLPALGVCFGNVITLLGPTSRPLGSFSWSRTAWHEFAHTITLGLSKGQVPRWLTEGLSVYEEKMRRADWGREMERELFHRYHNGRLLRMAKINSAFRGPDIMFAYFQGGLIAEHLTESRGFEVIPEMLRAFAKDRTTAQVFNDVLNIELEDYDRQLAEFVGRIVGGYRMVPLWDQESLESFQKRVKDDPSDAEAWVRLGWAHLQRGRSIDAGEALGRAMALESDAPEVVLLQGRLAEVNRRADLAARHYERYLDQGGDDLNVRLFLAGRLLADGGDSAKAVEHLEAAKRCFPTMVGKHSPYLQLAQMYRGAGEIGKAIAELEGYAAVAGEDYGVRKQLKTWYKRQEDHERVAALCGEMVDVSPFGANKGEKPDLELHRDYADALLALGRRDEALRELEVQVELVGLLPEEERVKAGAVEDHVRLGRRYLDAKRAVDALAEAAAALRLSRDDAAARMLKAEAEEAAGYR